MVLNQYRIFILVFSILTFTNIYGDYTYKTNLDFKHQSHNKNTREHKSHHDFSHNKTWDNSHSGRTSANKNQLSKYTAQDFHRHFTEHGYTNNEILDQRCLYIFDEFVKFAQTYSAYKCTITQLYTELQNLNFLQKAYY